MTWRHTHAHARQLATGLSLLALEGRHLNRPQNMFAGGSLRTQCLVVYRTQPWRNMQYPSVPSAPVGASDVMCHTIRRISARIRPGSFLPIECNYKPCTIVISAWWERCWNRVSVNAWYTESARLSCVTCDGIASDPVRLSTYSLLICPESPLQVDIDLFFVPPQLDGKPVELKPQISTAAVAVRSGFCRAYAARGSERVSYRLQSTDIGWDIFPVCL